VHSGMPGLSGRGHRPCHSAMLALVQPGAIAPASARPAHGGRFAPAGSGAGLSWWLDLPVCRAPSRTGGGNAVRFLIRPEWRKHFHRFNGRGHRPCHSATLILGQPGAKAPGQRPTRPRRALACAGPGLAGLQGAVPCGRGSALRFLIPPGEVKALSTLQWQGPSPLPNRCAWIRTGRGPKPPASARPAHGGRFAPAGSGAGLSWCLDLPVYRAPSRAGGETRVAFPVPARSGGPAHFGMPGLSGRGHRPCHSATLALVQPGAKAPGQRPTRRALRTRRVGRWPVLVRVARVFAGAPRRGGGNAGRVSCSRPKGQSLSPDQDDVPVRQAAEMLFQRPKPGATAVSRAAPAPRRA